MAKLRPLNDKILVKRIEEKEQTAGGIFLPGTAREKPLEGKVLALGDGPLLENNERGSFQVKKNDQVLFTSYAGSEVTVDGEELLLLSESEILGIVD